MTSTRFFPTTHLLLCWMILACNDDAGVSNADGSESAIVVTPEEQFLGNWQTDIELSGVPIEMVWTFREDGEMKWHILYPGASAEVHGTWSVTDTELFLEDEDCGDIIGHYEWTILGEPDTLTLAFMNDECPDRPEFLLTSPWYRHTNK